MTLLAAAQEPWHLDEAQLAQGCAAVLSQVAAERRPVIVQRGGADVAVVVPLEYLELIQDSLARQEAERVAALVDLDRLAGQSAPAERWFEDDEPKPF